MIDLETVRDFFSRGRTLIFAESEVFAILGQQRVLVAKLSATLAVVEPT